MDGPVSGLLLSGGILLAGAAWIWFRSDASLHKKAETTFVLSVFILCVDTAMGLFGPVKFPARPPEQPYDGGAVPDATSQGLSLNYGPGTAVYDIAAHAVYLPNGKSLEAHSGLDEMRDDPHYVNLQMRGSTPPNLYDLVPLAQLFHGAPALRLVPVGNDPLFGRSGFLAHGYMLGPRGDSHGCVVFRDFSSFLRAFRNGEIKRLVVVAHFDEEARLRAKVYAAAKLGQRK